MRLGLLGGEVMKHIPMGRRKTLTNRPTPPSPPGGGGGPEDPDAPKRAAFDLFLDRGLHALYDDVVNEPVPEELVRLVEQDRKK
jgi:hypothetical protein